MPELAKKKKPRLGRALAILQTIIGVTCSFLVVFGIISPLPVFIGVLAYAVALLIVAVYSLRRHKAWSDYALLGFVACFLNLNVIIAKIFNFDSLFTFGIIFLFIAILTRAILLADWKRYRCKGCGTRIPESGIPEYEGYCYSCYWSEDGPGWKKPISSPSGARAALLLDKAHIDRLQYELNKFYMHYICPKCTRPISFDSFAKTGPLCPNCGTQLFFECEKCEAEIAICDEFCWYCRTKNPNYDPRSHSK